MEWKGEKSVSIRKIVEKRKVSFLGLVETKHRRSIRIRMKRMWGNDEFDMCEVYANETNGGGVIASWDTKSFTVSNKYSGNRWILLEGRINRHNYECCVGVIYGQNDRIGRHFLFEEIKQKVVAINKPILLMGDFNVVLNNGERIGSFRCNLSMREFADWIEELGLIDIPLQGIKSRGEEMNQKAD